jgi:hypothetical protein
MEMFKHTHKHYFVTNKTEFEPVDPDKYEEEDLYRKNEYAILMCNSPCNDVKKVIVRKEVKLDEQ